MELSMHNREKWNAYMRNYQRKRYKEDKEYREKVKKRARKWHKQNPDKARAAVRKYNASKKGKKRRKEYDDEKYRQEREKILERGRKYRRKHRRKLRILSRKRNKERKLKIIKLLGGRCVKCGFDDWRTLQIDHIHGGGTKERKRHKGSGSNYYNHILKELQAGKGFDKYQLLCANCNWIKRYENKELFIN